MAEFKNQLMAAQNESINKVQFFTITGAKVPLCETVEDLNDYPVFCCVNNTHVYALNFSRETSIRDNHQDGIKDEEYYFDFASSVGLKGYQRYFYSAFSHKFINALPRNRGITRDDLNSTMSQVLHHFRAKGFESHY